MQKIGETVTKSKKYIEGNLRNEFLLASNDDMFKKVCNKLKLSEEILMKYTSSLEDCVCELKACSKCKNLDSCKNKVKGHIYFPKSYKNSIEFEYIPCKHYKNSLKDSNNTIFFETPESLRKANLSDLFNEKERNSIIKYITNFLSNNLDNKSSKGLYLSGSFGSGKSYILSALLNELSNKGYKTINVYFPTLIQKIKSSFDTGYYDDIIDEICSCDVLLLDDIGAENNTSWSRDEVLGVILQYRMDNNLVTFFTSNYTLDELETHLANTPKDNDPIKARRIIERIKYLTKEEVLVSKNKRNE